MTNAYRFAQRKDLQRISTVAIAVCLFFTVWGAKVAFVDAAGSDVPSWDQWDAEGETVIVPYLRGQLKWTDFFKPHNEHRIAFSRTLALGLFAVNGQWDTRLECVANAAVHALFAVAVFLFGRSLIGRGWSIVWFLFVAMMIAAPVSWHNTIGGVHSQQYFLLLFSVLGIAGILCDPAGGCRWWTGVVFCLFALFSMASGLVAPLSAAVLIVLTIRSRNDWRAKWPSLLACAILSTVGILLSVSFAGHETLRATSIGDFVKAIRFSLQWPVMNVAWFAVIAWLPWVLLGCRILVAPAKMSVGERVLACVGIWVLLQYAASAYARGAGGPVPANRYLDTVALGVLVNLLCLALLFKRTKVGSLGFAVVVAGAAVGLSLFAVGLYTHLKGTFNDTIPWLARILPQREVNTRAYLMTGDRSHLDGKEIPHVTVEALIYSLKIPELRVILPVSTRPPLALPGTSEPSGVFTHPGAAPWLGIPDFERSVGSFGPGNHSRAGAWTARDLPASSFGYWKLEFAGTPDDEGLSVKVIEPDRPHERAIPLPTNLSVDDWKAVYVKAPPENGSLQITDDSATGWIAFRGATEMATISFWAMRAAQNGIAITWIFFAMGFLMVAADFARERSATANRPDSASQPS